MGRQGSRGQARAFCEAQWVRAFVVAPVRILAGLLLLAWGVFVISTVDNVLRSWLLSGSVRAPFLVGFFGMLGGVIAFGSIGHFLWPVATTLGLALWCDWIRTPASHRDIEGSLEESGATVVTR